MKTFEDLIFKPHGGEFRYSERFRKAKRAIETFENGYGISVLFGEMFYSNGIDTYELAVLYKGKITYNTDITDDVMGGLSKDEVTDVMRRVQELK